MEQKKDEQGVQTRNILIVDDDPDTCQLLASLFGSKGYNTTLVYSGQEAIDYVESEEPNIIILDVMMPHMDGWETFKRMRNCSEVPVLFLTALASGENAARAMKMGASDYVRKPFHPAELLARVEVVFNNLRSRAGYANRRGANRSSLGRPTVSVIIPTLNEAKNLPLVLPKLPMDWIDEVVLVDGLSSDGTIEMAKKIMPSIHIVIEGALGKGAALSAGYNASCGDIIIVMDADGSHDPREIPRFISALLEGADFVKGSRFAPGGGTTDMPRFRQLGNRVFVFMVNLLFCATFTDLCYGYHAFWRYCLDTIDLADVNGFEIDTAVYVGALRERLRITEVPSFEGYRFHGIGKLRTIPDGLRVLRTIARELFRSLGESPQTNHIGFRENALEGRQIQMVPGEMEVRHPQ